MKFPPIGKMLAIEAWRMCKEIEIQAIFNQISQSIFKWGEWIGTQSENYRNLLPHNFFWHKFRENDISKEELVSQNIFLTR